MKLFIANATRQVVTFAYRLPERAGAITQVIPIGQQVQLSGDLTSDEVNCVIQQNERYGLVPIAEAERQGQFSGLCYSVDKPITEDRLRLAMMKRVAVIEDIGREQRKNAAISVHDQVEKHLGEHRGLGNINGLNMSIEEQDGSGSRTLVGGVEERITVQRARDDQPAPPRRGRPRRAA